jgi:hypothetical protein
MQIDLTSLRAFGELPRCPDCGAVARPNILMFHDHEWIADTTQQQRMRYVDWLDGLSGKRVVVIECGAGTAIATIRVEGERIAERFEGKLVRINPDASEEHERVIAVQLPAMQALTRIEQGLTQDFRRRWQLIPRTQDARALQRQLAPYTGDPIPRAPTTVGNRENVQQLWNNGVDDRKWETL